MSSRFQDTQRSPPTATRSPTSSSGAGLRRHAERHPQPGRRRHDRPGRLITVPIPPSPTRSRPRSASARRSLRSRSTRPRRPTCRSMSSARMTTTPNFMPVTDINPDDRHGQRRRLPRPRPSYRTPTRPTTLNGIPDAIITISPRSVAQAAQRHCRRSRSAARRSPTSPLPNFTWTGTATVTVTGGSSTPVVSGSPAPATGPGHSRPRSSRPSGPISTRRRSPSSRPSITSRSRCSVALQQYLPPPGFRQRIYSFNHPGKHVGPQTRPRPEYGLGPRGINTLEQHRSSTAAASTLRRSTPGRTSVQGRASSTASFRPKPSTRRSTTTCCSTVRSSKGHDLLRLSRGSRSP